MRRTIIIELDLPDIPHSLPLIFKDLPLKLTRILHRSPSVICDAPEDDDVLRWKVDGRIVGRITTCTPKSQPSLPQLLKDVQWLGSRVDVKTGLQPDGCSFEDYFNVECCPRCYKTEAEGHSDTCALHATVSTLTPRHPEH